MRAPLRRQKKKDKKTAPTCNREHGRLTGPLLPDDVDLALVLARVGDADPRQRVQQVLGAAGGLGVDHRAILVNGVDAAQCLGRHGADLGAAPQRGVVVSLEHGGWLHGQLDKLEDERWRREGGPIYIRLLD